MADITFAFGVGGCEVSIGPFNHRAAGEGTEPVGWGKQVARPKGRTHFAVTLCDPHLPPPTATRLRGAEGPEATGLTGKAVSLHTSTETCRQRTCQNTIFTIFGIFDCSNQLVRRATWYKVKWIKLKCNHNRTVDNQIYCYFYSQSTRRCEVFEGENFPSVWDEVLNIIVHIK